MANEQEWRRLIEKCNDLSMLEWIFKELDHSGAERALMPKVQDKIRELLVPEIEQQTSLRRLWEIESWHGRHPGIRATALLKILSLATTFDAAKEVVFKLFSDDVMLRRKTLEVMLGFATNEAQLKIVMYHNRGLDPEIDLRALQRICELI
jgi:hypothetical protein